jgi:hypothetical protein
VTACRTDIDWSTHPEPWRSIGPKFRLQCKKIVAEADAAAKRAAYRSRPDRARVAITAAPDRTSEEAAIEKFMAEHGAKMLPAGYAEATQAADPPA